MSETEKNYLADSEEPGDLAELFLAENSEGRDKRVEGLKRKDLLNYFRSIERECLQEISGCEEREGSTEFKRNEKKHSADPKGAQLKGEFANEAGNEKLRAEVLCGECACCPLRSLRFPRNKSPHSTETPATFVKTRSQGSRRISSDDHHKYSPKFYGRYSRKNVKTWPEVTEVTSLEVIKSWSHIPKRGPNVSNQALRKERRTDVRYQYESPEGIDVNDFINKSYVQNSRLLLDDLDSSEILHCEELLKEEEEQNREKSICHCDRSEKSYHTNQFFPSRHSKPAKSYRSLSSPVSTKQHPQRNNRLKHSRKTRRRNSNSDYTKTQRSYPEYEDQHKKRTLGEEKECCCERKGSEKLCKLVNKREDKRWLSCCCEAEETEKTEECSKYCCCPESVDNYRPPNCSSQRETTSNAIPDPLKPQNPLKSNTRLLRSSTPKREDHEISSWESFDSLNRTQRHISENSNNRNLKDRSMENKKIQAKKIGNRIENSRTVSQRETERVQYKTMDTDNRMTNKKQVSTTVRRTEVAGSRKAPDGFIYDERFELSDLTPDVPQEHWGSYEDRWRKVTNEYRKLTSTLRTAEREAIKPVAHRETRKRFTRTYPSGKEFSFEVRCPRKSQDDFPGRGDETKRHEIPRKTDTADQPSCCQLESKDSKYAEAESKFETVGEECEDPVRKLESLCERVKAINRAGSLYPRDSRANNAESDCLCESEVSVRELWRCQKCPGDPVRIVKPRSSGKTSLKKILVYPPEGEAGPPLTLYKKSSNINCQVKGDARSGFRYSVTYIQKFGSPVWHPDMRSDREQCECSDYG